MTSPLIVDGARECVRLVASLPSDWTTGDERHSAFVAGYEQGKAERVEVEVEDRARELLHDWAREALGLAKRSARHGAAFSAMVIESGERE